MTVHRSFCRICHNSCPQLVSVEDGRVVQVVGDPANAVYSGYTCIKGRAQPNYLYNPNRLLHSLKKCRNGGDFERISSTQAMDEIAERLSGILKQHGPRSIAGYSGTMSYVSGFVALPFYSALLEAIGTAMSFNPNTIDKGGKDTALSLHGHWMAPSQGYDDPEVVLFIGTNPIRTYTGFPLGNPGWYTDMQSKGMKSIVIDPRRSDTARLASLHLQPLPGHDAEIIAAMIRVILTEELYDTTFVAENVDGIAALRAHVEPFTHTEVARRADLPAEQIVLAARTFARAHRGYAMAGTGPNMSGPSTLLEYLVLSLETLCGHWLREGERVRAPPTLLPAPTYRAQAAPLRQTWDFGERIRVRGLAGTEAGLPTAALVDEILEPGEGQVRALISFGGNPASCFPDQIKTRRALQSLELLVQIDPWMSETARLAHYVVAPPMPLESPGSTVVFDMMAAAGKTGYGSGEAYAQYTPAIVEVPRQSDLLDEWRFFHGLLSRMDFDTSVRNPFAPSEPPIRPTDATSTDDVVEWISHGSRVPIDVVKQRPEGGVFPSPAVVVGPKLSDWEHRLNVANELMMADLDNLVTDTTDEPAFPFRLLCRREGHLFNTSCNSPATNRGRPFNPAYLNPQDLEALGLKDGDCIEIVSEIASISAIVQSDTALRPGLVSMMFGFDGAVDKDHPLGKNGSNPNKLISNDRVFDRFTGQPRMSNVPVAIRPHHESR